MDSSLVETQKFLVRVAAAEVIADNVKVLRFRATHGGSLPAWTAGAHIDVVLPNGLIRQYSLAGDVARKDEWTIAVLREMDGRGGSAFIFDEVKKDDILTVSAPRNHFELMQSPAYQFIAGGIGITPILPMIRAAEAAGAEWKLTYGGRNRTSMAFLELLAEYGDRIDIVPQDECGHPELDAIVRALPKSTPIYCCGPEPLLSAIEGACARLGHPEPRLERFVPKIFDEAENRSFEVVLAESGMTLTVPPDNTILNVLREAGVDVPASCEVGTCGTCWTAVLEGVPDHRDSVLTSSEKDANDCMIICTSRCLGDRLVLDL